MAGHARIAVGTTPTLLTTAETDSSPGSSISLKNVGTATVFLGGSTVTATGANIGFPLEVNEIFTADLHGRRDDLYGAVLTGTQNVAVLRLGV